MFASDTSSAARSAVSRRAERRSESVVLENRSEAVDVLVAEATVGWMGGVAEVVEPGAAAPEASGSTDDGASLTGSDGDGAIGAFDAPPGRCGALNDGTRARRAGHAFFT